jgi:hypothetical protein
MRIARWFVLVLLRLVLPVDAGEAGSSWRRVDEGMSEKLSSISWDGPVILGAGDRGLLATSQDGKAWTKRFLNIQCDLKGVAWNGSHYVAVGRQGTLFRSQDGLAWQSVPNSATGDYYGVVWTGSLFVAVEGFYVSTSADGLTWNRNLTGISNLGYGIVHFDGAFYILTYFGIYRSTNLTSWTRVLELSNRLPKTIRKLNGRLIAVEKSGGIHSSLDGIVWTPATFVTGGLVPSGDLNDVTWNGSNYVAVGETGLIWLSSDGTSWKLGNTGVGAMTHVNWIGGEYVALRTGLKFSTSPDGAQWTDHGSSKRGSGVSSVWTGTRCITVDSYGYIATFSDSESCTTRNSGTDASLSSVVWTGSFALATGVPLANGANGTVLKSTDGITWNSVAATTFIGNPSLVWNGFQIFAFASNGVFSSTDGVSWTQKSATAQSWTETVRWAGGQFFSFGPSGSLKTSDDGVTWVTRSSGTTSELLTVEWSGTEFLIGGTNGALLASPDGAIWTARTIPAISVCDIEYRFGRCFLASPTGIYQSSDGANWSLVSGVNRRSVANTRVKWVWSGARLWCTGLDAGSADGLVWTQDAALNEAPNLKSVAKSEHGFVAVGTGGAIKQSSNGFVWQFAESPTSSDLYAVAAGNGRWVAVGSGGTIVTSPDRLTWSKANGGITANLLDIAWNGLCFAAVGEGGTIITSPDGLVWKSHPVGTTSTFATVDAAGSAFVVFASYGGRVESPDGNTWTLKWPDRLVDVVWNGTNYLAVGGDGKVFISSPDALQWTSHQIAGPTSTAFLSGVCWTGQRYVACGTNGTLVTSPDGITWTRLDSGTTRWIQSVNWNGSQVVAVGAGGVLLVSPNGLTWDAPGTIVGSYQDYEDVAWANGRYVAVGNNGCSATSTNGRTWTSMSGTAPQTGLTVEWIGNRFAATGRSSSMCHTTGTTWINNGGFTTSSTVYDMEWDGSRLFAAAEDGVYRLQENVSGLWSMSRVYVSPMMDNITHHDNEFVAVGAYGTVVLSRDGLTWQTVKGGRVSAFSRVAWNGNRFVGLYSTTGPQVSADGETWRGPASLGGQTSSWWGDVVWTGSRFVSVGTRGFVSSPDADSWSSPGGPWEYPEGVGLAGDDELLVAVGSGGLIAVSEDPESAGARYRAWMTEQGAQPGNSDPLQDSNKDGISNLEAYAFGIPAASPIQSTDRQVMPAISIDPNSGILTMTFELRDSYRPGMIYTVEGSSDLKSGWSELQRHVGTWQSGPSAAAVTETTLPGGGVRVTISGFPVSNDQSRRFFRLRLALP